MAHLTVPAIFYQLYTIHGLVDEKSIPLVDVLLPGKTQTLYKKSLEENT